MNFVRIAAATTILVANLSPMRAMGETIAPPLSPTEESIAHTRAAFLALSRPLAYKYVLDKPARNPGATSLDAVSHIELYGDAKVLAENTPAAELIYALWPFLTNCMYDAEAFIVLEGALEPRIAGDWELNFVSLEKPGSWPGFRGHSIEHCQRMCRSALNQPEWWYPHPILFDRQRVLAESKTNAAVRLAYIDAMVKALADPNIRSENPLEVKNMFGILSAMKAIEATPSFCNYLFYDWKTGKDHRISAQDDVSNGSYPGSALGAVACLARLGKGTVSLVLDRFSRASPEELSTNTGGAGIPVLAIRYFTLLGISEADAIKQINDFRVKDPNLPEARKAALDSIVDAIQGKKYRPDFLSTERPEWSAPASTNIPPRKQP